MPELPEIVAHAERLGRAFAGAELAGFAPLHPTALKTFDPRPEAAAGQKLTGAGHRGKYLRLHFGDLVFVVHLMQGGRLRPHDPPASTSAPANPVANPALASAPANPAANPASASADPAPAKLALANPGPADPPANPASAAPTGPEPSPSAPAAKRAPANSASAAPTGPEPSPSAPAAKRAPANSASAASADPDQSAPAAKPPAKKAAKPRGGMARWLFADGRELLLTEAGTERRAGVWLVRGDPEGQEPLSRLGPDADQIGRDELARGLAAASERVHGYLRDQSRLAGIGRLLANEILHEARISPFANTARLDTDRIDRLHEAMTAAIARGLAHERDRSEMGKSADRPSNVHHRIGQPCITCGDEVRSVSYRRYVVAYCPTCQTGGKVLADNTTSRFLK